MANYQNYNANGTNNVDNSQFTNDMNQNNMLMFSTLMQNFENKAHMVNNNLVYSMPAQGFNFGQQLPNGFHQPYTNAVNGGIVQMPNNNLGVYINNQPFMNGENYINNMSQFIPMQAFSQGIVDVNAINKSGQQRQVQSRKKNYVDQSKESESKVTEYDHKNRPLIFDCKECPRKFSINSRLNTHMKCHNGDRPYKCPMCHFAFTQKSYLVRHAAVHKEERPYTCEKCNKSYKHYGSLANHRKTHKNGQSEALSNNALEEISEHQKNEPDLVSNVYQNHEYIYVEPVKQEPQHASMATDLSTHYQSSEQAISYLDQLNQYPQNVIFFNNTDTTDTAENMQSISNPVLSSQD